MKSCLIEAEVLHRRMRETHSFSYKVYYGFIDLDELDELDRSLRLFSASQRFAPFSLSAKDFIDFGHNDIKSNLLAWLRSRGFAQEVLSVKVFAHLRTFGFNFNPLSVFFIETPDGTTCVAEVDNTFGDAKLYLLGTMKDGRLLVRLPKNYYVSPFIEHDAEFVFDVRKSDKELSVQVTTIKNGTPILFASMRGHYRPLDDGRLLLHAIRSPLMPMRVLAAIHWQALRLVLKKIPFFRKHEYSDQQRDYYVRKTFTRHVS